MRFDWAEYASCITACVSVAVEQVRTYDIFDGDIIMNLKYMYSCIFISINVHSVYAIINLANRCNTIRFDITTNNFINIDIRSYPVV